MRVEKLKLTEKLSPPGFQGPVFCPVCEEGYALSYVEPTILNGCDAVIYHQKCIGGCGSEMIDDAGAKANKAEATRVGITRQFWSKK